MVDTEYLVDDYDDGSQQLSGLVQQITDVLSISSVLNSQKLFKQAAKRQLGIHFSPTE